MVVSSMWPIGPLVSFIIAKDYFSFPALTNGNNKEYKGFQLGKATVKVSLLFA